jgi:5-methylcytosine-specific restriction endonuclease McrA
MKVKIKDLKPNPYRDMENYPINQDKVQHLIASIKQTDFWDNVIARKSNGEIQIAYGHHRLEALKKVKKPTDEIEVPIKDLSDALMIQIMAKENDNDWETCVAVTDETVRVANRFIKEHPEEIKTKNPIRDKDGFTGKTKGYKYTPEAFQVGEFLGWGEEKVYYSLTRINMILDEELPLSKKDEKSDDSLKFDELDEQKVKTKKKKIKRKKTRKPIKNLLMPPKETIWKKYMKSKSKGKCYCCRIIYITVFNFHIGHNKPRSKGGSNHISNLRPICSSCNYKMGNRSTIEAYRKKLFTRKRKKK